MSYPPLSGYGSYYDSAPNQAGNNPYGSSRQPESTSYGQPYSGDDRQPTQYPPSSGYDWSSQGQHAYSQTPQQSYESWREANGQGSQYDYRREASSYATQAAAGNTQAYYPGSATTPATSSMAGLNNLAYASGLDNQRSATRTQQSSSKYSTTPTLSAPNRVQSPAQHPQAYSQQQQQQQQQRSYPTQNATSNPGREMSLTAASRNLETASQNLAISAAQALAGAVRSKQSAGVSQQSPSPAMSSTNATQRSHSPYTAAPSVHTQARAPSTQSQRNVANSSKSAILSPETAKAGSTTQAGASHGRTSSQSKRSAASQSNSISNLVTSTQEATPPTSATEAMPTYIDPTQVFNPYHKEHERRRREAAEVEARRKQEEASAAARAKEAQAQAQAQTQQKTAPKPNDSRPASKTNLQVSLPTDEEDEMAAEMKLVMEKMKSFRQKDPSMFHKLWEEMRKPGGPNNAATSVKSPSPQISQRRDVPPAQQPSTAATTAAPGASPSTTPATADGSVGKVLGPQGPRSRGPRQASHAASSFPHAQANGYKVVVENNEEGLPDLGRFPAERRIRAAYVPRNSTIGGPPMPAAASGAFPKSRLASSRAPATAPGTIPGPLPAKTASGGIEWPKDKRDALAKAAIDALKLVPENTSVEISADDIHAMLEQNPSYIQLCDLLEKKGLKFHRGYFARQLLTSVPDLTTPQKTKEPPPAPTGTTPASAPPKMKVPPSVPSMAPNGYSLPATGYLPPPPATFPPTTNFQPPSMSIYGPPPPNQFQAMGSFTPVKFQFPVDQKSVSKVKKHSIPLGKPEPPPGSKEAMARKRDFSELIDLTQLSDNDDYVLSSKHLRLESPSPEPDPFEKYQLEANVQPPTIQPIASFSLNTQAPPQGAPPKFDPVQRQSAAPAAPPPPPQPQKTILAKPVNKGEALRKSYYDPKTVARDVLIAAGRHPQERPLNAHMASLLGKHIELDSDLSTFDWEAIDPGGPPMPRVPYVDIPAAPPRFHLGQRTDRDIRKARDHQLGNEAERSRLPHLVRRNPADAAPARAPPGPQFSKVRFAKKYSGRGRPPRDAIREDPKPSRLREAQGVDDARSPPKGLTPQRKPNLNSANPSSTDRTPRSSSRQARKSMESDMGALYPSGKRRGRPPGSKNKHVSVAVIKKFNNPIPLPQAETEVPAKPIFKCRWKGCKTELHNLDTLRRHVAKVHCPTEGETEESGFLCWWRKCQYLQADEDGDIVPIHSFATPEEWVAHISEDHLHKIAMKLGDGPNTSQIGKTKSLPFDLSRFRYQSPLNVEANTRTGSYTDSQTLAQAKTRYLADEQGRNTTSAVTKTGNQELPADAMTFTKPVGDEAEAAAQKAFMKAHRPGEKMGPKSNAEEMLRAMEARKAKIGPGIDRGGCTLVSDARRASFVQNPGVRRVVDADY